MTHNGQVLAFMAHPDDIEILCAGTLIHLRRKGFSIHMATMTAGDGGSAELSGPKIPCGSVSRKHEPLPTS